MICAKDKIMMEGYEAFHQGDTVFDNPYDIYMMEAHYDLWFEGFYNAASEDDEGVSNVLFGAGANCMDDV